MHDAMSAVAGNTATKKQIADLASSGIDLNSAKAIRSQIKKHGEIIDDLVFPNITKWDAKAKGFGELYVSAVKKSGGWWDSDSGCRYYSIMDVKEWLYFIWSIPVVCFFFYAKDTHTYSPRF